MRGRFWTNATRNKLLWLAVRSRELPGVSVGVTARLWAPSTQVARWISHCRPRRIRIKRIRGGPWTWAEAWLALSLGAACQRGPTCGEAECDGTDYCGNTSCQLDDGWGHRSCREHKDDDREADPRRAPPQAQLGCQDP